MFKHAPLTLVKTYSRACAGHAIRAEGSRSFCTTTRRSKSHFDTHRFVQRLEREGLNRAQAQGIMTAMAEVIDESIRNMTSNMVTKADQEKVCGSRKESGLCIDAGTIAPLYTTSGLCAAQVRVAADGEERPCDAQGGERPSRD